MAKRATLAELEAKLAMYRRMGLKNSAAKAQAQIDAMKRAGERLAKFKRATPSVDAFNVVLFLTCVLTEGQVLTLLPRFFGPVELARVLLRLYMMGG